MATVNGPVQNRGQIRWWYSVDGYSASADFVTVRVDAYFYQSSWTQEYNGSKSWSGTWGSGSAGQAYFLTAGQQVKIVTTGGVRVPLTGSARTVQFSVSTSHFYGATSHTLSVPVPARYASTPTNLKVTRNSDVSHLLQWSRQSTYSSVVVQRSTNGGAWTQVARPSGNAANWTDTTTKAGNKYDYRVAGVGGGGQSGWSNTATVYTSPNTPSGVSATRNGNNIVVDVSGKPAYATGYNIRDGATQVASNVQLPWTHVNPAPANTHTYTVQAVRGSLTSGWSSASNTVQLLAAPQAPTNLAPNGAVVSSEGQTRLSWRHNPTDSSPQTAAEYRRRVKGTSSWTTGTATTASNVALTLAAGEIEWQVRTKGQHPDWSPWSAVAVFTVIDKPGVAITDPGELWTRRTVTVKWTFDQGQGRPQSGWEASLLLGGEVIEHRTGSGAGRSVAFTTPLVDTQEYEVIVKAAAGDVWSDAGAQSFFVQVPPAAPADMDGVWSEESGAVTVEVHDGRGDVLDPVTNHFPNPRFAGDGTWVELRRNLAVDPAFTSLRKKLGTATNNMSSGGGAQLSTDDKWSVVGGSSLKVGVGSNSGAAYVNWAGSSEGMSLDVWGGKRYTVAATVFRGAVAGDLGQGANTPPRAIAVGIDVDGVRTWVHARSDLAPDTIGETRLVVSFDLPTGSASDFWFIRLFNGSATQPVWWDALTVEEGNTDGSFFGWDYIPHEGMRVRALGTAPFAQSVLEGERVRGLNAVSCHAVVSSSDGSPAVLLAPTSETDANSYASFAIPPVLHVEGRVTAQLEVLEPTGAGGANSRRLNADGPWQRSSPQHPDVPGFYANELVFSGMLDPSRVRLYHGGIRGSAWVKWSLVGLFDPTYSGPVFDGSSGLVQIGDSWMGASWDGTPDNSTSTLRMAQAAVRADVERSVNGGITWVPFIEGAELPILETDTESLSNGVTLYRVTTYSADDASSVVVHEVVSDSPAAWLSAGDGFTHAVRMPYDPEVGLVGGAERVTRRYAGRSKPVVHTGEARTRELSYSGTLLYEEYTPEDMLDLFYEPGVMLYRDRDGRHIYGAVGDVQQSRVSPQHWSFSFGISESER